MLSVQSVRRNLFISVFLFLIIIFQVSAASAQVGDLKNLNFQIKKNLKQGNYVQAEKLAGRAASIAGRRFGKNHPHYATAINTLGVVYQQQSKVRKAIKLHNQALRIRQSRFGNNHPAVAAILKNLGIAYTKLGQYQKALSYLNRSNKIFTRRFGASHISVAGNLNNIAKIYERMGKYEKSVQLYKKSMQIKKRRFGSKHISVMGTMRNLGQAYEQQGKLDQAMEIYRKLLDDSKRRFAANHPTRGILLGNIGRIYSKQGRIDEAIAATKQSIAIFEKSRGNRKLPLADSLNNLAISYQKKKEYKKSIPLLEKSMVLKESLFGKSHISLSSSLGNLARAYRETGQLEKSVILIKRALEIKRKYLGVRHPSYGASLSSLALIRIKQFRHPEAEKLFKQSLQISKKSLGEAHPETLQGINNFAGINMSKGEFKRAYFYLEDGVKSISSRERISGSSVITGHRATDNRFELVCRNHIRAAYGAYEKHGDIRAYLNDAAFRSAQKINSGIASSAISQMAARVTSGKPELGALVRKQQDVFQRWQRVNKALEKVIIRKETAQTRETEVRLKTELAGLKNEGDALSGRLEKEFPKYQELSNPRPLKLEEVQKLLGADELLVFYLVSRNELFIWAVSQQDSDWFRGKVSKEDLSSRIEAMRKSLDPDKLDSPDNLFDMKNSHEIYRMIFEPLISMASGKKKILIVPSGPLVSLPFQTLITKEPIRAVPEKMAGYKDADWFIKQYSIAMLPSVSSLYALRELADDNRAKEPFIGYSNPVFKGKGKSSRKVASVNKKDTRSFADFYKKGAGVDTKLLGNSLVALPETEDELYTVARYLGAPKEMVRVARQATEADVKKQKLDQYQVVYFATHGLVAGDLEKIGSRFAEPALALTIPSRASKLDDGLLTASEIAKLKLNTDWVILSACNTAIDGRPESEALSGLSKAFLYAGSRALLVSHWPVYSDAAVKLTTRLFRELKDNSKVDKAEALRLSMLALMNDESDEINPYPGSWAPFIVVGDGR